MQINYFMLTKPSCGCKSWFAIPGDDPQDELAKMQQMYPGQTIEAITKDQYEELQAKLKGRP
jgi:hypothetical protein